MSSGIEIVKQVNVVREVIDIQKRDYQDGNTKNDYIGNYHVDIQNPKRGDMIEFRDSKWKLIHKSKVTDGGNF